MADPEPQKPESLPDQYQIESETTITLTKLPKLTRAHIPARKKKVQFSKPVSKLKKRYFTAGVDLDDAEIKDLRQEPSPFEYPKDLEVFAHKVMTKAWRNDVRINELHMKCFQKPSHRGRHKKDLLARLYVEDPPKDSMKTILDIDPEYYKAVEGRPIPDKLDIKQYINTVRDSLRTRIINGYREDDIMLIEENLLLEQKIIDSVKENYEKYVNVFEEFLYRDHTSATQLLQDSDRAAADAYQKYEEYKEVANKFAALRSALYNTEEKWRGCLMYEKFLFLVSPFAWRTERMKRSKRLSVYKTDDDTDENIFGKYQLTKEDEEMSLEELLMRFEQECMEDEAPELYFTDPEQLADVFRFMEMQNLNSLLHSEELALPLEQIKEGMSRAEEMFDEEIRNLREIVDRLEEGILWEEDRAKYLEELALNLINNEFKKLIVDDEVLNLHVFVEDVYETRIGPNDANLSMVEMMNAVEAKYRSELLSLDMVPAEEVAVLEGSYYLEQMTVMRLAEKAAKQYQELEQITRKLNKAFAEPYVKPRGKEPKKRSPPVAHRSRQVAPPRELTDSEREYLEYFTEFCSHTDDPKEYGIDVFDKNKKNEVEIVKNYG
ncbi:cilia- and flagella-associated protein 100-like [Cylas formicarius]|uniref:cilia- and flagella-associated protein 100-like n=1 Tax=Cylas formicarius TaxID=197179 RepID=UPI0029585798|nr:cilia- and flagella-associated protein 100-like [Cylas formicarius]